MLLYPKHINLLKKFVPMINYLDIGSRGGISGWFELIKENLNIISFEAEENEGLFNYTGSKKFYKTRDGFTSSFFKPNLIIKKFESQDHRFDYKELDMRIDTLDNKMIKFSKKIDLLKIDTQGSEFEIIEGGIKTISENRPFIFVETWSYPYYENIRYFDEIIQKLRDINYEIYLLEVAASDRLDCKNIFKENFGEKKHTGFNIFLAPSIEELCKLNNEEELIKRSFIFFVLDLLSFSYKIVENTNSEYKIALEKIIKKRIKYKNFYKIINYLNYIKFKFTKKKNTSSFRLT